MSNILVIKQKEGDRIKAIMDFLKLEHNVNIVFLSMVGIKKNTSCYKNVENLSKLCNYDIIITEGWNVARDFFPTIKRCMPDAKLIIDADLQFRCAETECQMCSHFRVNSIEYCNINIKKYSLGETIKYRNDELEMYKVADKCFVPSEIDKEILLKELPEIQVSVLELPISGQIKQINLGD